jgi:hypothetical protein
MGAAIAVAATNVNQWLKQECLETNAGIPYMAANRMRFLASRVYGSRRLHRALTVKWC